VVCTINCADGTISAHYEYDPFGRLICKEGVYANDNEYRFSTKRYNAAWGFYDYGYRHYSPDFGRWMSRDPIGEDGGVNIYAFVRNKTQRYIDAEGLDPFETTGAPTVDGREVLFHLIVKIGEIPEGMPQQLLRHYMWGPPTDFLITPERFAGEQFRSSVYSPNIQPNITDLPLALADDIRDKCKEGTTVEWEGKYAYGCAHRVKGGLGNFVMDADVTVCCHGPDKWSITGTSTFRKEDWDFHRDWGKFFKAVNKNGLNWGDLGEHDVRTHVGSFIAGKPFKVSVTAPLKIRQTDEDEYVKYEVNN
jgi:RHS repeat-associated protein